MQPPQRRVTQTESGVFAPSWRGRRPRNSRALLPSMVDWFVLRHSKRAAIAGGLSTTLFVGAIVMAARSAEASERPLIWACLVFTPATALLLLEALRARHVVGPTGLRYRGLIRAYAFVPWSTVERARWSDWAKRLTLYTSDGRVLHFSALLEGLDLLARCLAEHAPHVHTEPETATMLAAARNGQVPQVWW